MKIDERFDGVDEAFPHLVDLVEDEEGLRTLAHVAPDPVLEVKLERDRRKNCFLNFNFITLRWSKLVFMIAVQTNQISHLMNPY